MHGIIYRHIGRTGLGWMHGQIFFHISSWKIWQPYSSGTVIVAVVEERRLLSVFWFASDSFSSLWDTTAAGIRVNSSSCSKSNGYTSSLSRHTAMWTHTLSWAQVYPSKPGTRFGDPDGMQGWVDLVGSLTRQKTVARPRTNRLEFFHARSSANHSATPPVV